MVYFTVRARAEAARMTAAYGGITLNESTYQYPLDETDTQGYYGCDYITAKTSGKLPFGQLPVLVIDDKVELGQSGSINRYLAGLVTKTKSGFIPEDPVKAAQADALHETAQDLFMIMPIVNVWKGDKWKKEKEDYFNNTLPGKLPALVKMLGAQQYFCGDRVTYADFALYVIMDLVRLVEPGVVSQHNNITAWMARVEQLEGVKQYLDNRPTRIGIGVEPKSVPRN